MIGRAKTRDGGKEMLQRGEDQGLCVCVCVCCPWGAEDGAGIEKNSHIAVYCSYFCCYCWLGFLCCFGDFFFFFFGGRGCGLVWFEGFFCLSVCFGFQERSLNEIGPQNIKLLLSLSKYLLLNCC